MMCGYMLQRSIIIVMACGYETYTGFWFTSEKIKFVHVECLFNVAFMFGTLLSSLCDHLFVHYT